MWVHISANRPFPKRANYSANEYMITATSQMDKMSIRCFFCLHCCLQPHYDVYSKTAKQFHHHMLTVTSYLPSHAHSCTHSGLHSRCHQRVCRIKRVSFKVPTLLQLLTNTVDISLLVFSIIELNTYWSTLCCPYGSSPVNSGTQQKYLIVHKPAW